MAIECLRQENYRLALRAFYLANLAWLGQRGFIAIHAGKTNREYELELRRKARQFAEARGLFGDNVSAFEAAWYGMHEVSGESVAEFRDEARRNEKGDGMSGLSPFDHPRLAAGFVYVASGFFGIQFAAGVVYPEYSSLRSDPMGAKLLFDSLTGIAGIRAERNYLPLEYLPDAARLSSCSKWVTKSDSRTRPEAAGCAAARGGSVVMAMSGDRPARNQSVRCEALEEPGR